MKKLISIILSTIIAITCIVPFTAFAEDNVENNLEFTQEEFESLEHVYATSVQPYSSSLIVGHTLGIAKDKNILLITGSTKCSSDVVKCGFTKVVIQRRSSSSASWSNYKTFTDLYDDDNRYQLSKRVTVTSGYQYRVTATHYAKKSLISTQKVDSTTESLSF